MASGCFNSQLKYHFNQDQHLDSRIRRCQQNEGLEYWEESWYTWNILPVGFKVIIKLELIWVLKWRS